MPEPVPSNRQPQLRMEVVGLTAAPVGTTPLRVPPGYGLRTFRPGDEDAWVGLLQTGDFTPWDRARLDALLANERVRTPPEGAFFVTKDDRPVGATSTQLHDEPGGIEAELGWVVVAPEHRGHGLGLVVCRAVLDFIGRLGHDRAYLKTDDFRLPAIQTYLTLGFEPAMVHESHPARWAAILGLLAERHR